MLNNNERYLSVIEIENELRALENKYRVSTAEFLRNQELRMRLPEDDVFAGIS